MRVLTNVDLGKSFEELKDALHRSYEDAKGVRPDRFAHSLGRLETAVKKHLFVCTDYESKDEKDDIPHGLYQRPGND
jgi:hypothetical protein